MMDGWRGGWWMKGGWKNKWKEGCRDDGQREGWVWDGGG